ncbi:MAG: GNAT family N-acetyltransferase, partial [Pseudomonadota bacterium]
NANASLAVVATAVQQAVLAKCEEINASSWHVLFPQDDLRDQLKSQRLLLRTGCQYQWFNNGYADFEAFLATFASRKRKNLRKERSAVQEAGITLQTLEGPDVSAAQWEQFYEFYASTYFVRGRRPYLNTGFFLQLGRSMPEQLMLVLALRGDKPVAGALFFKGRDTLYGRYWGCAEEVPFLHFEACYYQGIDYCIRHGLQRMDSGAQGEHKIQRGFAPVPTWSAHWIGHADFRKAIAEYVKEEEAHIGNYMQQAADYLPFRKDLKL